MRKNLKIIIIIIVPLILGALFFSTVKNDRVAESLLLQDKLAEVYRSKGCGCCANYVKYLQRAGVQVEVKLIEDKDMPAIRKQFSVSDELASCHTTRIENYTVEGHMPIEVIEKLVTEKPQLAGIALPAMPAGSPGMPGRKTETFKISGFDQTGLTIPYFNL